ncbi:PaaI family thioesterase [Aquibaculum sediminis]|uniref:PaaI family thioesterase n=1 Tax=Aquibaculum sediminis TaxID=3231907 RepID=UPI003454176A
MARITVEEISEIAKELKWVTLLGITVEEVGEGSSRLRLPASEEVLRPGGTISGPTMMTLADFAMYVAVLGAIGRVEMALTTNLSINFLRPPPPGDLIGDCRLLKLGKRLAYGEVLITSAAVSDGEPVAHSTLTYSIPPER